MTFYDQSKENVLSNLNSNRTSGLTHSEVEKRTQEYGENKMREKAKKSTLSRFLDQFKDTMILILLAAAVVSFVVAIMEQDAGELFEPLLIVLIVVINAVLGVMQESKAEKALEALKNMSAPHARVLRDGKEEMIDAVGLVPGDIILLEAGDFIPADARLLKSSQLKCEESALTGESLPVEKDADAIVKQEAALGDRINMIYTGCSVTYGSATAVVCATGMETEMGKIATLLHEEEEGQTPLQAKLAQLGQYLGIVAIAACLIIFVVGVSNGIEMMEIFMTAISLAVSAIPEGLPAIVTIVLSIGVQRMVKKNAIIRSLPAVETLGSASVICSDKTGTLTQNRMTLVKTYLHETNELKDLEATETLAVQQLLNYGTLCCSGAVEEVDGEVKHLGDPTETAIVYASLKQGFSKTDLLNQYPKVYEFPFDSDRKLMSTIHQLDNRYLVVVKGAFDELARRLGAQDVSGARQANQTMSENALRVLGVAYKYMDHFDDSMTMEEVERNLTFIGLVGMIDPPREEAKDAVHLCRQAGIKPVMITGDHVITASAIARQLGILRDGEEAIMGRELDAMSERELDDRLTNISVYARVSPENKIRIVKAWQRKNQVVAMTGDGVNDAPALKAADIGCAMGITGTDVAKGAADMTLTDDNFATIVDAVKEGRGIYANIKKVVGFLLGTNIGEVVLVFVAMLLWHTSPLMSMQLLWINLVTDSLPAIALGMEAVEDDVMDAKPKPKDESIFANGYGLRIILQGFMFGLLALAAFYIGREQLGLAGGQTMAFYVLAMSQILQAFNMRSDKSIFKIGLFTNKTLNQAVLISIVLTAIVLFTPLASIFGLITLTPQLYFIGAGLFMIPTVVMEVTKLFHK